MLRIKKFQAKQKESRSKPVFILALITAVSLLGDSMLYIVLPIHWREAGLISLVEVGVLLSANRFIRLPLNPLISWLYSRMSLRVGLFVSLLIAGGTTLLYGWAQGFVFWFILRCVWGLAWSILRLGAYYMILDLSTNENRGHLMGTFNGLSRIGSLAGMLGGGFFIEWFGIRDVTFVFGLMSFLILPLILQIPSAVHIGGPEGTKVTASSLLKTPLLMRMLVTVFFFMLCLEGMITATLSHLIEVRNVSIRLDAVIIGAAALASIIQGSRLIVSVFLSPWIGKKSDGRWGRRPYLITALLLGAVFITLVEFQIPVYLWLSNLLAILLISSILVVLMDAFTSDIAEEKSKAATIMLYVIIADVGAAFGPVLGYLSEQSLGLSATYGISAAVLFLLSVQWVFSREKSSDQAQSTQNTTT
ncbi:MFS transporter [Paenibacillus solisilvae]|uniref:MFS transporter n=1 Tax=Paenibacillus solisilvae TaxID=2486751 RepID=A0ABW0VU09_9BACL